jgi:hypothetical protein
MAANFCPSCGAPLQPGAGLCANCGRGAGGDPEARSNATAALVFSVVGLCLPIVFPIVGLVKGVSAKERLARAGEPTGAATAAIVIGAVGLASGAIIILTYLASL